MTTDPLPVLWRDDHLIAVEKPSGLAVHRGWAAERDVALTRVRDALGVHVYPVHRLDRGTSGVLLMALTPEMAGSIGTLFATGQVQKRYLALVRGVPPEQGLIDHPLTPGEDRQAERLPAQTAFTRQETFGRYALVEARPLTGRLHQVRRHLKHISCPLIGDVNYGKGEHNRLFRERFGLHRLFLHASELRFPHPGTQQEMVVTSPLPPELTAVLEGLRRFTAPP